MRSLVQVCTWLHTDCVYSTRDGGRYARTLGFRLPWQWKFYCGLLGYGAVLSGRQLPKHWRSLLPTSSGRNKFGSRRLLRNICNFLRKYKVSYIRKLQSKNRRILFLMYVMVRGNRETSCLARLLTLDLYVRYECRLLLHSNRAVFMNYNSV